MFDLNAYLMGGLALTVFAFTGWLISLWKNDVSIVDSLWSVMFMQLTLVFLLTASQYDQLGIRALIVALLVFVWGIRLAAHITWRNWGEEEDHRYQKIRRKYAPNFAVKSLFIIFGFQAMLAWIISLPILAALTGSQTIGILGYIGVFIVIFGILFESIADYQLMRFKAMPANKGQVMKAGLWRYSRHPNYFGECSVWWGLFLLALGAGGWWSIVSPLLMTFLLLKFSGVALLEKDIKQRRPAYQEYIDTTNAFIPGRPLELQLSQSNNKTAS